MVTYVREGEDRYKTYKLEQKIKEKFKKEKEVKIKKRKKQINRIEKALSKTMTYKSSNPLRKILKSNGKKIKIKVQHNEPINLWK